MPQYQLIFQSRDNSALIKNMELGVMEYPFELRAGDVVVLDETLWKRIREEYPEAVSPQMWVGQVIHFLPEPDLPALFLVVRQSYISKYNAPIG